MSGNDIAAGGVIAVLLADGWHQIVPGSFSVGPLGFGAGADLDVLGFRFEEADAGRPYRPTVLAGPVDSLIAIRQVAPAVRRIGDAEDLAVRRRRRHPDYAQAIATREPG